MMEKQIREMCKITRFLNREKMPRGSHFNEPAVVMSSLIVKQVTENLAFCSFTNRPYFSTVDISLWNWGGERRQKQNE